MQQQLKTILLIDDNEDIVEALTLLLEEEGYHVITNTKGDYVDVLNANYLPDIIVLDMLLSGKDGREIIYKLKTNEHTHTIPIILTSAHPEAKNIWKQSGADDFLEKPFEIESLLTAITRALSSSH